MKKIRDYEKYIDVDANEFASKQNKKHLKKMHREEKREFLKQNLRKKPNEDDI